MTPGTLKVETMEPWNLKPWGKEPTNQPATLSN